MHTLPYTTKYAHTYTFAFTDGVPQNLFTQTRDTHRSTTLGVASSL